MPVRGKIIDLTFSCDRIEATIREFNGEPFSYIDALKRSGVKKSALFSFLKSRIIKGAIKKLQNGLYQQLSTHLRSRKRLPQALVAENLWRIILKAEKPLTGAEYVERVESKIGIPDLNLYFQVFNDISKWSRQEVIERFGKRGSYTYFKKDGITTRPSLETYPKRP